MSRVHEELGRFRKYISITHKDKPVVDKFGLHPVIRLEDNPDPNDERKAYAVDYIYTGTERDLKTRKDDYVTTKANKKVFDGIIEKHKK